MIAMDNIANSELGCMVSEQNASDPSAASEIIDTEVFIFDECPTQ